ncbi:hypothetical protein BC332_16193 [Capsicum chinense]|nr:hypothetical protein BC332_16193 [Capsicum chinense]
MDNIPKLKTPMCFTLVFFIDHWLYVISFDNPNGGRPMLNMSHLSKGWVSLPRPNTFLYPAIDYELATLIVDDGHSNETTLYVKSCDGYILLAFSFKDQTWYTYTIGKPLTPLTCHLLSLSWWDHLVIIENHLYSFQRNKSQFLLIIRDLESVPDNKVDEGTITCEVHQDVLNDKLAFYSLRYLGNKGSCRRFFVAILYSSRNHHSLVSTCTFDLSGEFKVQKSSCQDKPLNPGSYLTHPLQCEV